MGVARGSPKVPLPLSHSGPEPGFHRLIPHPPLFSCRGRAAETSPAVRWTSPSPGATPLSQNAYALPRPNWADRGIGLVSLAKQNRNRNCRCTVAVLLQLFLLPLPPTTRPLL